MAWLLDTNILAELRRLKPQPKVLAFVSAHPLDELYISAVTLAEPRFGVELLSQGSTRRDDKIQSRSEPVASVLRCCQ